MLVKNSNMGTPRLKLSTPLRKLLRIQELTLKELPVLVESLSLDGEVPKATGVVVRGGTPVFVEPPQAAPHPGYTGLPLEEPPTAKIKKELLWRKRKGLPEPLPEPLDAVSRRYDSLLEPEATSSPSHVRSPLLTKPRKQTKRRRSDNLDLLRNSLAASLIVSSPATPKTKGRGKTLRTLKRVKVSLPKKAPLLALGGGQHTVHLGLEVEESDATKDNDDYCASCGLPGIFICCETCPKLFHFTCADPPLAEVPDDDWFCHECWATAHPETIPAAKGIFGPLINQLARRNPVAFALPRNVRQDTFLGVRTGDSGDYEDDSTKPELVMSRFDRNQIKGCNRDDLLEIDGLYDINGAPYLCHKCGGLGLDHRQLVHCDHCPLVWHLDCLPYAMCSAKHMGQKWRCPNHVEDLLPRSYSNYRMVRDTPIMDVAIQNHFLRVAALTRLVVLKYDDVPCLKPGYLPSLGDYVAWEESERRMEADSAKNTGDNKPKKEKREAKENKSSNEPTPAPQYSRPPFLQSFTQADSVAAPITKKLAASRILGAGHGVIYRVPEELIALDFITKVKTETEVHKLRRGKRVETRVVESVKSQVSKFHELYHEKSESEARIDTLAQDPNVQSACESLADFRERPWSKHSWDTFVTTVLKEHSVLDDVDVPPVQVEEVDDLINIKRLLQSCDRSELMRFFDRNKEKMPNLSKSQSSSWDNNLPDSEVSTRAATPISIAIEEHEKSDLVEKFEQNGLSHSNEITLGKGITTDTDSNLDAFDEKAIACLDSTNGNVE